MARSKNPTLPELAIESWMLAGEMGMVIWLRTMVMMTGGKVAEREASRMISEKLVANMMLWPKLMAGGPNQSVETLGAKTLAHYRRPVEANRKRLSRQTA